MSDLQSLVANIRSNPFPTTASEAEVKQGIVLPILAALGWSWADVREVTPEFTVGSRRVDYCLRSSTANLVFIEVKRPSETLDQHQEQLLDYAFREGVQLAILTNGLTWWLYLPLSQGSWDQRKFLSVDLQQQDSTVAATRINEFLEKTAIASGRAIERAREVHQSAEKGRVIGKFLPLAWDELIRVPDELLVELLVDRVEALSGHRPDNEAAAEFLSRVSAAPGPPESAPRPPLRREDFDNRNERRMPRSPVAGAAASGYIGAKPVGYIFLGQRHTVTTFRDILLELGAALAGQRPAEFERVLTLRGHKRTYFSRTPQSLTDPKPIAGTSIYAEANLNANDIVKRCHEMLELCGFTPSDFRVEIIR